MARVEMHVDQDPAHVRVVRLVSAALGRRAGLSDEALDEVRIAVSELCGLSLAALEAAGLDGPTTFVFDDRGGLLVTVRTPADLQPALADDAARPNAALVPDRIAVVRGLLDDGVDVRCGPDGSAVTLRWPDEHPRP